MKIMNDPDALQSPAPDGALPATTHHFRDALARVPAAVVVVATDGPAGLGGYTATAFTSVSDDPPTILVCLNQKSSQTDVFLRNAIFSVNMLAADDEAIANDFAGFTKLATSDRFRSARWAKAVTGAPMLERARVSLDCRLVDLKSVATHNVLFGEVKAIRFHSATPERPEVLLYHDRHYRAI